MSNAVVVAAPPAWETLRKERVRFVHSRVGDCSTCEDADEPTLEVGR